MQATREGRRRSKGGGGWLVTTAVNQGEMRLRRLRCKQSGMISWPCSQLNCLDNSQDVMQPCCLSLSKIKVKEKSEISFHRTLTVFQFFLPIYGQICMKTEAVEVKFKVKSLSFVAWLGLVDLYSGITICLVSLAKGHIRAACNILRAI